MKLESTGSLRLRALQRPTTVKEHVYQALHEQLMHGNLRPNQRIVEKELTEQLGVSRTPVREALGRLATEGLLVATRRGYRVPQFTADDIRNQFEVRLLLEPEAARQAALHEGPQGLAEMREAASAEVAAHAAEDINAFLAAHRQFRTAWMARLRNPLLLETVARTMQSIDLLRRWSLSDPVLRGIVIASHRALLKSIAQRDAARAKANQAAAIRKFMQRLLARLSQEPH
jgi:DNA-binding GntR family transcriptional regulator